MIITCRKYKTSRRSIHETEPAFLLFLFGKLMPEAKFRFITFDRDNYTKSCLTFLLFNVVPEKVSVSIENNYNIIPAMREIARMNSHIDWNAV